MLIELTYGARSFKNWYGSSNSVHAPTQKEIINNWGSHYTDGTYIDKQLIDIPNTLIFSILSTGLPDSCFLYYDFLEQKIYFTGSIHNIYNFKNGSNVGYAKSSNSVPYDAFDWGGSYFTNKDSSFCEIVPDECFEDFYEVIKPYFEYDFTKKLVKLCTESFNFICTNDEPAPVAPDSDYSSNKNERYRMKCSSDFWDVLIHDMFHGNLYKDFSEKYPHTVQSFNEVLVGLQNHYLTYDNIDYDPRNKSK